MLQRMLLVLLALFRLGNVRRRLRPRFRPGYFRPGLLLERPAFLDAPDGNGGGGDGDGGGEGDGGDGDGDGDGNGDGDGDGAPAWDPNGYELEFDGEKMPVKSPEDMRKAFETVSRKYHEAKKSSGSQADLLAEFKKIMGGKPDDKDKGGGKPDDKDKGGGKPDDKPKGGNDKTPQGITQEQVIDLFFKLQGITQQDQAGRAQAESFIQEKKLDVTVDQLAEYMEKEGIQSYQHAAKLMTYEDELKKAQAMGRKQGADDSRFSFKPITPKGGGKTAPKSVEDFLAIDDDEQFDKAFLAAMESDK